MLNEWIKVLKTLLGIPENDTSKDAIITFLAGIVLEQITLATGRQFIPGVYRDRMNPANVVYLTESPVFDVSSIQFHNGGPINPDEFTFNPQTGRVIFLNPRCYCDASECCRGPLEVTYTANGALPPPWVSMAAADAIRAAMAQTEAGNIYGFAAKKVAVTDVGSVELSSMGDTPSTTISASVAASISPYLEPSYGSSYSCCRIAQTSELLEEVTPP